MHARPTRVADAILAHGDGGLWMPHTSKDGRSSVTFAWAKIGFAVSDYLTSQASVKGANTLVESNSASTPASETSGTNASTSVAFACGFVNDGDASVWVLCGEGLWPEAGDGGRRSFCLFDAADEMR